VKKKQLQLAINTANTISIDFTKTANANFVTLLR